MWTSRPKRKRKVNYMIGIGLALLAAFIFVVICRIQFKRQRKLFLATMMGLAFPPIFMTHSESSEGPSDGGGGGAIETYTNLVPVPVTIGGIAAGITFTARTMTAMWDLLLYPYQLPSFSAFNISAVTYKEVGDSIAGAITFTWTTVNGANVVTNSLVINDVTGSATLATSVADSGSKGVTLAAPIVKTTATYNRFRLSGTDTEANTFTRNLDVNWYWRVYYGEEGATSLNEAAIKLLRVSGLQAGFAGTYVFTTGGYKYFCWPKALGAATSFKDSSTSLDVDMQAPVDVSVTNTYGVATDYYVYRTTYVLGAAISIVVA